MYSQKRLLLFLVTLCTALFSAKPAGAQGLFPPVPPPIPPDSDAWISFNANTGGFVGPFGITEQQEEPNGFFANTGIPTASANGTAVRLSENNTSYSDYVYAVAGFLYFSSDSQAGNIPFHPLFPNGAADLNIVGTLNQTGGWQQIDQFFVGTPPAWVASDLDVPEPASGLALAGAFGLLALRRRI